MCIKFERETPLPFEVTSGLELPNLTLDLNLADTTKMYPST